MAKNVLGGDLEPCCMSPMTGFHRDGFCNTGPGDYGVRVVCAQVTEDFLVFSRRQGNDLSTPVVGYGFPGPKPGDRGASAPCVGGKPWMPAPRLR